MRARWLGTLVVGLALATMSGAMPQAHAAPVPPRVGGERPEAKPRFEVHERSLSLLMFLEASNGYKGSVTTRGHRQVTLTLRKGYTTIEARTRGRVTRHGINARFGDLGKISVRFRGKPFSLAFPGDKEGKRRCRGRKSEFESGLFRGTIRFRGENGFTQVSSKRVRGFVDRHYRRVCRRDPEDSFARVLKRLIELMPVTTLRANARVERTNVRFEAAAIDFRPILGPGVGLAYVASAQTMERDRGMRLTRSVSAEGDEGSFLFRRGKKAPRTATVAPPRPFVGTAKYLKEPGSPASWAGSLAARLPGAGLVAMTGPNFRVVTCNMTLGALLKGRCRPGSGRTQSQTLLRLGRALPQISGSQSQLFGDARLSWSR
jgi:hypothetical protein